MPVIPTIFAAKIHETNFAYPCSRYGQPLRCLKQLDGLGPNEEVIIEYSIYDAIRAGFGKIVFVIREDIEEAFREKFGGKFDDKVEIEYAFQAINTPVEASANSLNGKSLGYSPRCAGRSRQNQRALRGHQCG